MSHLLHKLKAQEADSRKAALADYLAILEKGDGATPTDQEAIARIMSVLGKSAADVEVDLRAVVKRKECRTLLDAEPGREKEYIEARKAHGELAAEIGRRIEELQTKLAESLGRLHAKEMAYHTCRRAANPLTELERTHWELFGLPSPGDGLRAASISPNAFA
ncbi:MAG TPA: hypothetical protein VHX86_16180 [Tepidisphaeraceae bacterium]|jgi:hypothetical protein|nr:hypothetical protein [Tepidisphaeraceae bacterium]